MEGGDCKLTKRRASGRLYVVLAILSAVFFCWLLVLIFLMARPTTAQFAQRIQPKDADFGPGRDLSRTCEGTLRREYDGMRKGRPRGPHHQRLGRAHID